MYIHIYIYLHSANYPSKRLVVNVDLANFYNFKLVHVRFRLNIAGIEY